jgi:hypothetical protein
MQRGLTQFSQTREVPASQMRRSLFLFERDLKARVEPDGSTSWVHSSAARKLLFGREATEVFKIQSGVKISLRPQDIIVKATPTRVTHSARGQERIQTTQSVRLLSVACAGSSRSVTVTNRGDSVAKVRVLTLYDPTSLNYRRERDPPGDIGVNAFNRNDHVVMDDVGDTTGVRVVAFEPRPSVIYMTKDRSRALELLSQGELPESSLGMSGSVILLVQRDLDLVPGESAEVRSVSVYHPSSLESALAAAAHPAAEGEPAASGGVGFASSNPSMNFAFEWAKAALFAIEGETSVAEKLWSGVALSLVRGDHFQRMAESITIGMRKDGTLDHSEAGSGNERRPRPGPVETSLFLVALCAYTIARSGDKKLLKRWYSHVRRAADGLCKAASGGLVPASSESPDGWRRRLGAGFPTGFSSEVNLIAVRALRDASVVAHLAGKGSDSASFREVSERLVHSLNERLTESSSGDLALNVDGRGVVHKEATIDQAVGLSYFAHDQNLASSVVHRLLERDFETGYGPRTVPYSNNLYYSPTYADGQLGGYWTRAAISHAILAFRSGYPSIASALLERVARLVHLDTERMGGLPGEFPYWVDPERKQVTMPGTDPVAAARFIEAVVFGEGGFSLDPNGETLRVPEASHLRWLLIHDLELGRKGSVFVGRGTGRAFVASTFGREGYDRTSMPKEESATTYSRFPDCERFACPVGVEGVVFWDASTTLACLGSTGSAFSGLVSIPSRGKSLAASLFAQVEELHHDTGLWSQTDRVRPLGSLDTHVELKPNSWKMLRVSVG